MQRRSAFAFFDTALGRCSVSWSAVGLLGVQLPGMDEAADRRRIMRLHPDAEEQALTGPAGEAAAGICALVSLGDADLSAIELDMPRIGAFERDVYSVTREIPPGRTITYGEIARRLGDARQARRVGQALGRNPWPLVVPCHRVLGADGSLVGFSAPGGVETKLRLLSLERARTSDAPALFEDLPLAMRRR